MPNIFEISDKNWKDTISEMTEGQEYKDLPDGKYQAVIATIEHKIAKTGLEQLSWKFVVAEGKHENRHIYMRTPYAGEYVHITIKCAATLGYDTAAEFKKAFQSDALNGVMVELTLKTKGDNQNVFINKKIVQKFKQETGKDNTETIEEVEDLPF